MRLILVSKDVLIEVLILSTILPLPTATPMDTELTWLVRRGQTAPNVGVDLRRLKIALASGAYSQAKLVGYTDGSLNESYVSGVETATKKWEKGGVKLCHVTGPSSPLIFL